MSAYVCEKKSNIQTHTHAHTHATTPSTNVLERRNREIIHTTLSHVWLEPSLTKLMNVLFQEFWNQSELEMSSRKWNSDDLCFSKFKYMYINLMFGYASGPKWNLELDSIWMLCSCNRSIHFDFVSSLIASESQRIVLMTR